MENYYMLRQRNKYGSERQTYVKIPRGARHDTVNTRLDHYIRIPATTNHQRPFIIIHKATRDDSLWWAKATSRH